MARAAKSHRTQPDAVVLADGRHRAHHEIAAGDQGQGVDQGGAPVQRLLIGVEQLRVAHAGEGIGGEEDGEDRELRQDEDPDGQISRWVAYIRNQEQEDERYDQMKLGV
jgi:hypothetical protein